MIDFSLEKLKDSERTTTNIDKNIIETKEIREEMNQEMKLFGGSKIVGLH